MAAVAVPDGWVGLLEIDDTFTQILPAGTHHFWAATKSAEANVIKRREETNATRALFNTAKVMAENPVMLRPKELEAIAGKVERLTVHNGTDGLMNDLVRFRE